ncbi:MAG: MBL fold metallo-hydrolase [Paludibacteraceae bacterium]|nr:MBL fold metallo-hydrolase [Paludibacteraceae bacterium]
MKFCSFASGSSGNCYYIGTDRCGILIDAGISVKSIKKNLKNIGVDLSQIYAVFVTHDHFDHISSVGVLGETYHIPVYSTSLVLEGVNRCYKVTEKLHQSRRVMPVGTTVNIGDIAVTSFPVSHDSSDCVGYYITTDDGSSLTIATDMGHITPVVSDYLLKARNIVIESNYDELRLLEGPYPLYLKERILSDTGHLANHVAAAFLAENLHLASWNRVFFCHLSKENNLPELVLEKVSSEFEYQGVRKEEIPELMVLPRTAAIDVIDFSK